MKSITILYENEEILIVNKLAGLAVQGGEGIAHPLDEVLSQQVGYKIYPVHRLDRDTAGVLVVAKSSTAAARWTKLLVSGQVKKEYEAICTGIPKSLKGVISLSVETRGQTKNARTNYQVMQTAHLTVSQVPGAPQTEGTSKVQDAPQTEGTTQSESVSQPEIQLSTAKTYPFSLIRFVLDTGRMHQIRIHAAKSGFPLAGDDKYGNFKLNKELRKAFGVKILQLSAVRLTLPLNGVQKVFEIPLPPHMQDFYNRVKNWNDSNVQ